MNGIVAILAHDMACKAGNEWMFKYNPKDDHDSKKDKKEDSNNDKKEDFNLWFLSWCIAFILILLGVGIWKLFFT